LFREVFKKIEFELFREAFKKIEFKLFRGVFKKIEFELFKNGAQKLFGECFVGKKNCLFRLRNALTFLVENSLAVALNGGNFLLTATPLESPNPACVAREHK